MSDQFDDLCRACQRLDLESRLRLMRRLEKRLVAEGPDGLRFGCHSRTELKRISKHKKWDLPIADWIAAFTDGDVFYDIGANVGSFSLRAAKQHGDKLRVFSFEPGYETFAALTRNVFLNQLERIVTPLQFALYDETGLLPFHYHEMGAGSALHALGEAVDFTRRRFEPVAVQLVPAFRLDDLVRQLRLPRPTRVKLDVDGVEERVLAGATDTLSGGPCELWVELTEVEAGDAGPKRIAALLAGLGFEMVRRVDHDAPSKAYKHLYDAFFVRR